MMLASTRLSQFQSHGLKAPEFPGLGVNLKELLNAIVVSHALPVSLHGWHLLHGDAVDPGQQNRGLTEHGPRLPLLQRLVPLWPQFAVHASSRQQPWAGAEQLCE
jgi:hypothetical protein